MKSIKFNSRNSKEIKSKCEKIHNLEEGITKALLEKYKPKVLYSIGALNEKKAKSRAI